MRRRLAVGGMGELFLGDETLPDGSQRPCVIKRLLPGAGPEDRRLFEREGQVLTALRGTPEIVELYRHGPDWLLLEWVDGVDLATLLDHRQRRGRPLPAAAAMAVSLGLVRALAALSSATDAAGQPLGLVHRDIHPGNVLLGRDGRVKLADFGVVALAAATQGVKGTLAWMAPEQLRSGHTTAASDVYAAALVMYACFTGKSTLPATHGLGELLAARAALPATPSSIRPELAWLDPLMMAALAVEPSARPSVTTLRVQLEAAPVSPNPTELGALVAPLSTNVQPAQRTLLVSSVASPRRRPLLPALAVVAVALGLGVLALALGSQDDEVAVAPPRAASVDVKLADSPLEPSPVDVKLADSPLELALVDVKLADTSPEPSPVDVKLADSSLEPAPVDVKLAHSPVEPAFVDVKPAPQARRLRVLAADGPVHVSGDASRGLAPWSSQAITVGTATTLTLTGGARPLRATVRVQSTPAALVASIGADDVLRVTCGARSGQTPLFGIGLVASGVRCRLEHDDGRSMTFVLVDVSE